MGSEPNFLLEIKKNIEENNIKNQSVFDINTKLTEDLVYKRDQMLEMGKMIYYFIETDYKQHLQIQGISGIGKTAQIIYLTDVFKKQYENTAIHYVNCNQHNTSYQAMKALINNQLKLSYATILDKFIKTFNNGTKSILILDEIDHLKDDKLLYTITRELKLKNVYMVLLTNKTNYYNNLSVDVQSSLHHKFFYMDRYNQDEIYEILKLRAKEGLVQCDEGMLKMIAAINAKHFNSDIRLGIKTMAEIFIGADYGKYAYEDVAKIMKDKQANQTNITIRNLNDTNLVLLYLTLKYQTSNKLYKKFNDAGYNYVKSYFFQFLDELQKLDLIYCVRKREHRSFVVEVLNKLDENNINFVRQLILDKGLITAEEVE